MEWSETKTVIREVQQLFSREDDLRDISEIQRMTWDLDLYFQNSKRGAREIIKELVSSVSRKEAAMSSSHKTSTASHTERLKAYQEQKGAIAQEINQYQAEIEASTEQIRLGVVYMLLILLFVVVSILFLFNGFI